jgi:hypothetical protein
LSFFFNFDRSSRILNFSLHNIQIIMHTIIVCNSHTPTKSIQLHIF